MGSERRAHSLWALKRSLLLVAALLAPNCGTTREDPTGGETHFLQRCEGAGACGGDLVCACGVCTLPCVERSACEQFPTAVCRPVAAAASCQVASVGLCDVTCIADVDCSDLSAAHRCTAGVCRDTPPPSGSCLPRATSANEVVVLGDIFFALNHRVTAFLEDLAREAGAISLGERYRDYSSVASNTLALGGTGIADQYTTAAAESPVKTVVMTGGGADVLIGSCDTVAADCPLLVDAAEAARSLLQRMADDGVEHVVYAFYPDPTDPVLRAEIRALRPLLESACQASSVPCEWVDLRTNFVGNESTYLDATGTTPTPAGAQTAARAIWGALRGQCVSDP